ncbi:Proliferating cell nuclear antigen domain protein [Ostertagia ostertagi]
MGQISTILRQRAQVCPLSKDYAAGADQGPASRLPRRHAEDCTMFTDTPHSVNCLLGVAFSGKGDNGQSVITYSPNSSADSEDDAVTLEVTDPVNVNFSIKYMNQFTKASSLSSRVRISLSNDVPIVVEYPLTDDGKSTGQQNGHLRFYLAPKIDEEENMD